MATILASQSDEARAKGVALIRQADRLSCESWNERMWADGGPIDPSPTVDQAINGGYPWLAIECSRCKTQRDVDLASLHHVPTTFIHDLAARLRCANSRNGLAMRLRRLEACAGVDGLSSPRFYGAVSVTAR